MTVRCVRCSTLFYRADEGQPCPQCGGTEATYLTGDAKDRPLDLSQITFGPSGDGGYTIQYKPEGLKQNIAALTARLLLALLDKVSTLEGEKEQAHG